MEILVKPCGPYQTNCYIVRIDGKELIIDPGVDADIWVSKQVKNPIAILNTHGHFDHVWSNQSLKKKYHIPIYAPKNDLFMLSDDPFSQGTPPSTADVVIDGDKSIIIEGIEVVFNLYPGHTPGCSIIEIGDNIFSGDFIFKGSIGRYDFPYSNAVDMKNSIKKFLQRDDEKTIYPGHGDKTSISAEKRVLEYFYKIV